MHKDIIYTGSSKVTAYRADRQIHVAPKIVKEITEDGVRFYKDDRGRLHVAETYDRIFGSRNSAAIVVKPKFQYQRTFKPNR
jgi:hypothetical protein